MKMIVVYHSKTGYTKEYATLIANKYNCPLVEVKHMNLSMLSCYDLVIYGGNIMAGNVSGLKDVLKHTSSNLIVFATGLTSPQDDNTINTVWQNNLPNLSIPHFYYMGGLNLGNLSFLKRKLLGMIKKQILQKEIKSEDDLKIIAAFDQPTSFVDESYLSDLYLQIDLKNK